MPMDWLPEVLAVGQHTMLCLLNEKVHRRTLQVFACTLHYLWSLRALGHPRRLSWEEMVFMQRLPNILEKEFLSQRYIDEDQSGDKKQRRTQSMSMVRSQNSPERLAHLWKNSKYIIFGRRFLPTGPRTFPAVRTQSHLELSMTARRSRRHWKMVTCESFPDHRLNYQGNTECYDFVNGLDYIRINLDNVLPTCMSCCCMGFLYQLIQWF